MALFGSGLIPPLTTMSDGTLKQVSPFSGTEVWTVPGRGNRPLFRPALNPVPLGEHAHTQTCAFCSGRPLDTPPEKSRIVPDPSQPDGWRIDYGLLPREQESTQNSYAFRRVPNLFEIVPFRYWEENYGYMVDDETRERKRRYLADETGRAHVDSIVETRLRASGQEPEEVSESEKAKLATAYFAGGHDIIIGRRHYLDQATHDNQILSSGLLSPDEHYAMTRLTVDSIRDLYERNRYAPYVVAFQNWLAPAGASFEHLHKQLVAIDERGVQSELEIERLRRNPNMYNEWAVDYSGYHNLIIAENEHAVMLAGVGHRYPTIGIYSKSAQPYPWLLSIEELRSMSDLMHAAHAATGPEVPANEEWHYQPIDLDMPMPWRVNLKWRVSNLAGFEGVTKIYINTLSPTDVRDRVVSALYQLRDAGQVSAGIRIAMECTTERNMLRYNPLLKDR
ncbi:DUF4921 family protein [Corynebacterium guangdongense]|uniref:Galactose-1-phosphate uridylyltransferase n=1 Tax=Corynebacterium guangdongense TaxID=1783348 RepID=A0ABU1ZXU2_9CORY|nr:DUF4921 family protein [Corynebacterium guangdongense]MDR7329665.1 galactose-1-phosphate uridylyltransferase [Corynebacterium guangdongense]WJZ18229.1 hypothetical protein CGUA_08340 [Corynebacterium guangdongense]